MAALESLDTWKCHRLASGRSVSRLLPAFGAMKV
jgi:hypothetical protein